MKRILAMASLLCSTLAFSQQPYWQQQVNHTIQVSLNEKEHSLRGTQQIEYINNSPNALPFIWLHLWPNAYKNENSAYAQQIFKDDEGKKRWKNMKEKGFIDSLRFTVDGQTATAEAHPQYNDIIKLVLPKALQPGTKAVINTPFYVKIPTYSSRSGFSGDTYMMAQWYAKPAVYDAKGWHPIPYLDQGEFYNDFGNYDVSITVPSNYIVGATGLLQNEAEKAQYKNMGSKNAAAGSLKNVVAYTAPVGATKTLQYKADNVTDFAWFADKDFVVRYDTLQLSAKTIDVFTYHHPDGNKNWVNSTSYVKNGARKYSAYLGEYPYPIVQAVEGPKNEMSGGMEYPTITLITSPEANEETLDAVLAHEVGHNWLCIILASNERQYAWMDEGINTYYQFRYEAEQHKSNSIFGDVLPAELKQRPTEEFQAIVYSAMKQIPMEGAIDIPSPEFANKEEYGLITYIKTAMWLHQIELNVGREKLDKAMQAYYQQWKFKHPQPSDLKAVLEKELNTDLTPYFDLLKKKGNL